jgi:ABC-2 type transport system ATP-binding protein
MNAVEVDRLSVSYPPSRSGGAPRAALSDVSFSVREAEIFGLLGPNGGGKSTLFRVLSTQLRPSGGRASVAGLDVVADPDGVRRAVGVVFQHPSLDGVLTLRENLTHQGRLYGLSGRDLAERADGWLTRFGLSSRADERSSALSGGLRRRGEIAKGLLHKPRVLLMDEPSTGLDPAARREMWSCLEDLRREGVTVLLTTHLMEEADGCDRVVLLDEGRVAALGAPADLKQEVGGEVLSVRSKDPSALRESLRSKFGLAAEEADGVVRVEAEGAHTLLPRIVEALPGLVESATVAKPSLEDVFLHKTGRRWRAGEDRP